MYKLNAAKVSGLSPEHKVTAALRVLAYGVSTDAVDEYVHIGNSTACQTLRHFVNGMVDCFADTHLRKPTPDDLEKILQSNA